MLDKKLQPLTQPVLSSFASIAIKAGISADVASIIGFFFGLIAACLIGFGYFSLALVFFIINRIMDGLDGAIARADKPTYRGGFLDIVFDFIIYSAIPFAFAVYDRGNSFAACFVIFSFVGTGTSFLAYGIMHAQLSEKKKGLFTQKSFYYLGGFIEGTETLIFIIIILCFPSLFSIVALSFGCLCWISTIFRIHAGWRDFSLK